MRRLISLGLASVLLLGVAAPVGAVPAPTPFQQPIVLLLATLTGAAERPGPGDPDGTGQALIVVNRLSNELCYWVFVQGITLPTTGNHIHLAPSTAPGPVVVPMDNPGETGFAFGCTAVGAVLLNNIADNPSQYYVNVHTLPLYAAGAVRGQLYNPVAPGT